MRATRAQADMSAERRHAFLRENTHFVPTAYVRALERRQGVDLTDPSALLGSRRVAIGLRDNFRREIVCVGYREGDLKTFKPTPLVENRN